MLIGRVVGQVVSTAQHPSHSGLKLLLVAPLDLEDKETAAPCLAADSADAGLGDRVLVTSEGWAAMTAVGRPRSPIDAAIIAVVDTVDLAGDAAGQRESTRLGTSD